MSTATNLSQEQSDALNTTEVPVCILAGAGSGKTRVITHRIAYLVRDLGVKPSHILGVTFTNKAAKEMKQRVLDLLPYDGIMVNLGTFHGLSAKFLRLYGNVINIPQDFLIYDEDDSEKLIKKIIKEHLVLDKDEQKILISQVLHAREKSKDQSKPLAQKILGLYEEEMIKIGALDFSSLLKKFYELLSSEEGLKIMSSRVRHILVDEFQDINDIQSQIVNILSKNALTAAIVGDDDQSIYGWRGASAKFMHEFLQSFPSCKLYRLEDNYRSTPAILEAANAVITHNEVRLGKTLKAKSVCSSKVGLKRFFRDQQEAKWVVEEALRQFAYLGAGSEVAVLMRTNAQSRVFEEALHRARMPYRLVGGMRFYDRKEIKDILAAFKFCLNQKSDVDALRLLSALSFGIGAKTISDINQIALSQGINFWQAMGLSSNKKVKAFFDKIEKLKLEIASLEADAALLAVIKSFGFVEHYEAIGDSDALSRIENIEQLVMAAQSFMEDAKRNNEPHSAIKFLENVALISDDESIENKSERAVGVLTLMTLHAAKGLEFDSVFLVGLEEGILPHSRSLNDFDEKKLKDNIEEERRLMYVGITRAKKRLFLSFCEERFLYGKTSPTIPSRFLREIPPGSIEEKDRWILNRDKLSKFNNLNQTKSFKISHQDILQNKWSRQAGSNR